MESIKENSWDTSAGIKKRIFFRNDQPVIPPDKRRTAGPTPLFGDDEWDLTAMGLNPTQKRSDARFDLGKIPQEWKQTVRDVLMILVNDEDPILRAQGFFPSYSTGKLISLKKRFYALRNLIKCAVDLGIYSNLSEWNEDDIEEILAKARTRWRPHGVAQVEGILHVLQDFSPMLEYPLLANAPPISFRVSSKEIRTRPLEPDDFWALMRTCWTYIDVYGPDILAAKRELEESIRETPLKASEPGEVDAAITYFLEDSDSYVPLHTGFRSNPRGEINWAALTTKIGVAPTSFADPRRKPMRAKRREKIQEAIAAGFPAKIGSFDGNPSEIINSSGESKPWCEGFDGQYLEFELGKLQTACYIFISALSMMRASEVLSIEAGCIGHQYGAPVIHSKVLKHQKYPGKPDFWWVSDPVVRAVKVAEEIVDGSGILFRGIRLEEKKERFNTGKKVPNFLEWTNRLSSSRGLEKITDLNVTPHRLRRTMAILTALQPDGELALGITLKHNYVRNFANAVTSGYGGLTDSWAKEMGVEIAEANATQLLASWSKYWKGELSLKGPGGGELRKKFEKIDRNLPKGVSIESPRVIRDMLRDEFSNIHLGIYNHCLGDPAKAECLKDLEEEAKKDGPMLDECMRATCRNSVIMNEHVPLWESREAELSQLLKDRRMAPRHRERLKLELRDVQRITQS